MSCFGAQGVRAVLRRRADFLACAVLWTWWWSFVCSDFVAGAVSHDFGNVAGFQKLEEVEAALWHLSCCESGA